MTLHEKLAALPVRGPSPGDTPRLDQAVARISSSYPEFDAVAPKDLEAIIYKLAFALSSQNWHGVKEGDVAIVVRAFAADRGAPLPPPVLRFLRRELEQTTRGSLLMALCEGFIASWAPSDARVRYLASIIKERAQWLPKKLQTLFSNVPEFFDVDGGATTFGQWMVAERDPYQAVLAKGIPEPHGPGFMAHAHAAWLAALPPISNQSLVDRFFRWIAPAGRNVLSGERAAASVYRLLEPWHFKMPAAEMRTVVVQKLLDAYKDPRKENEGFWGRVGDRGKRVMLRWLAGRRMEAFIDVVTRAEAQGAHRGQWENRRRFWMGMYEQGRIDEAWVAYTKKASSYAEELQAETGDASYGNYGLQGGARKDTCLLIMQIGQKIIVEGSHDFRVHVFSGNDPKAPKLYEKRYDVEDFILPFPHRDARVHDWPGEWMNWVKDRVR